MFRVNTAVGMDRLGDGAGIHNNAEPVEERSCPAVPTLFVLSTIVVISALPFAERES